MEQYDHKKIEKKWQRFWQEKHTFEAGEDQKKEKNYILIEFPYPSGDGLHVGHVRSWTALDIVARKRRAEGKNVLYPIGWDAFGLPTENYAIKTGKDPRIVTKENTDTFRRQIQSLGISFDWSREINTSDPDYYRWTQWIFLQLYRQGLAYKAKTYINWCPKDKIGLANEEVIDGACERCGTPVEKREKEQWMMAITKYAQRLYDDLDTVDYIPQAKLQQRNWIGPSQGAEIRFPIKDSDRSIAVFTTRPDTLYGATYVVLAPELLLAAQLAEQAENRDELKEYIVATQQVSEMERTAEGKEKTGIEMKGIRAINPVTKKEIPIFVANYVLGGYGTGAVMGVPAHDQRDYLFAKRFHLPIQTVLEPLITKKEGEDALQSSLPLVERRSVVAVIKHWSEDKYLGVRWKRTNWQAFVIGGIEAGEDAAAAGKREIREETGYRNATPVRSLGGTVHAQFYQTLKQENRFAHFEPMLFQLENAERDPITPEEQALHDLVWLSPEEMDAFITHPDMQIIWDRVKGNECYTGEGILIHSGTFDGLESEVAKEKITASVDGVPRTVFRLRDWIFSRQRYWGEPIPMIQCPSCGWVPVPESELPVLLPEVDRYEPTDSGESPLAAITSWVETMCPSCKGPAKRETDVMPNWAGSSWYYLRYCDPKNTKQFASEDTLRYWTPVDWYNGGMEHATLHLLYSRFWHKALYDLKLVPTSEPYMKRTSHGLILAAGGEKMSKSKGNVVNPDDIVERYGADALRLYEMFLGPFDQPVAWNEDSIIGVRRFLERVWKLAKQPTAQEPAPETEQLLAHTIAKITSDIESLKCNTAVSQLMIMLKTFEQYAPTEEQLQIFLQLLAPFAPHIAEEVWQGKGNTSLLEELPWPTYNPEILVSKEVTIAVQINGKVRSTISAPLDAPEQEVIERARSDNKVQTWLARGTETRVMYVPGRVVNFILDL